MQSVGAVIVNFNAGKHLLACVASARREGIERIVVIDNGSDDGSPERLLTADPEVHLIRLANPGFGAANNVGIDALDTDVVFMINPDAVLHEGAVDTLRITMNSDPAIAICGPRLSNVDGSLYPSARNFPSLRHAIGHGVMFMVWKNNPWTRRYRRLDEDYTKQAEVEWLSGAALFARRSAVLSVGGFHEAYFLYMDDTELCWQLHRRGWKMVYEPAAVLTHIGGVSTGRAPYKRLRHHHMSAIRYNVRTARGIDRVLLPIVVAGLAARLPIAWLQHLLSSRRATSE